MYYVMYILLGLAVIIAVVLLIAAMQPGELRVMRSATMGAAPGLVFGQVNDFHQWQAWSPWAKMDPNAKQTYEGAAAGKGAIFAWEGNNKVGAGKMTMTESTPGERIKIKLEFYKPFKCTNHAEFTFVPEGNGTTVTWTMTGKKIFMAKVMGLFMDMDKMVGGDFEKGLAGMKGIAERA